MKTPSAGLKVRFDQEPAKIRVTFTEQVDFKTVTAGDPTIKPSTAYSFLVDDTNTNAVPAGQTAPAGAYVVDFSLTSRSKVFSPGTYQVTLFGNADAAAKRPAISSTSLQALDGEPTQLPSGNGVPGGDFVFQLQVV